MTIPENADLTTLIALNKQFNDQQLQTEVQTAKISNPAREVEESLVDFVTNRLAKISSNADFEDLIRMHIRERISEASFNQLIELLHSSSQDTNRASEGILSMFKNESSGKNLVDTLSDNSVASTAATLYNSTNDRKTLQAIGYLSSIMSQLTPSTDNTTTVEIVK